MARLACSLPNRAPFGLPRLSIPNKTNGDGEHLADVEWLALVVMIMSPGIKKGPGQGPWVSWVTARPAAGLIGTQAALAATTGAAHQTMSCIIILMQPPVAVK